MGLERRDLDKVLKMEDLTMVFSTCLFGMEPRWEGISIIKTSIIDEKKVHEWLDQECPSKVHDRGGVA